MQIDYITIATETEPPLCLGERGRVERNCSNCSFTYSCKVACSEFNASHPDIRKVEDAIKADKRYISRRKGASQQPASRDVYALPGDVNNQAEIDAILDGLEAELAKAGCDDCAPIEPAVPTESTWETERAVVPIALDISGLVLDGPTIAPFRREYPPLPAKRRGAEYSQGDDLTLQQQKFDDVVYAHQQGHRATEIDAPEYRTMLAGNVLDKSVVWAFAAERFTAAHTVKLLMLPLHLEVQMSQCIRPEVKERRRAVMRKRPGVEKALRDSLHATGDREQSTHVPRWVAVWTCKALLQTESKRTIAQFAMPIAGKEIPASSVLRALKSIKERLPSGML